MPAAVIYTALETARLNGVNPERWLADVLARLAAGHGQLTIDKLLPWDWQKPTLLRIAAWIGQRLRLSAAFVGRSHQGRERPPLTISRGDGPYRFGPSRG